MAHALLDLRGVRCPLTWARARVHLESHRCGEIVDLLVDDPQSARDLPRAAEAAGHHLVGIEESGGIWTIAIEV
jgi:tRNA 2-thiouridine synthesizing protein A